jgi:thiocyanate hydrolase subunit alpha
LATIQGSPGDLFKIEGMDGDRFPVIATQRGELTMKTTDAGNLPARFNVGDRVRVKDLSNLFYSRTQMSVRGVSGTIAVRIHQSVIPQHEAWNRDDVPPQPLYIVCFRLKDLWEEYPFENDTLQSKLPEGCLDPATD